MAAHPQASPSGSKAQSRPDDPLDLQTSVAGEEDPGAFFDAPDLPAGQAAGPANTPRQAMSPGDAAPFGTPGTGETMCPRCGGSGRLGAGDCPDCGGTGRINVGMGGA